MAGDAIETLATQASLRGAKLDISRNLDNDSWTITITRPELEPACYYYCGYRGQKLSALVNSVNGRLQWT